jgi:O-methyltransferase involved in polyketide biosynthesis
LGSLPSHLVLTPIDFEFESITDALSGHGFNSLSNVFVSWLGTICYLTHGAIEETFASLAKVCSSGSRVVFDYFQPKLTMSPSDLQLFEMLDAGGTRRGEPMKTTISSSKDRWT